MAWIQTVPMEELEKKKKMIVRHGPKQIAVLKSGDRIFALDNRCPHEGYPLVEGNIQEKNCVLTCNWHNWKFDLNTGSNLYGDDDVAVYETKVDGEMLSIHIPEIPKEVMAEKALLQLRRAFDDQQHDRIARELARIHFNGIDPLVALKKAIEWSHDRLEYGMTHAFAVTADWLALYHEFSDVEDRLICLVEAIDYMAEESLRQPVFPYTEKRIPFEHGAFLEAVEQEDEERSVAMILGALESGLHCADLERSLTGAALQHYNSFGHSLIYTTKVISLIDRLGPEMEKFLLPPLVRSYCYATREDLLPEFRKLPAVLPEWSDATQPSRQFLQPQELDGLGVDASLKWTLQHSADSNPAELYDALLRAGAWNLLHFDLRCESRVDNSVSQNIGWLDFTHALTFGNAVRKQCVKFPEYWKYGLLQMACFAGRNRAYVDRAVDEREWEAADADRFFRETPVTLLNMDRGTPIYIAHYVKTFLAVREEAPLASAECADLLTASCRRYLESPLREKHPRRTMRQALSLVGKDFG